MGCLKKIVRIIAIAVTGLILLVIGLVTLVIVLTNFVDDDYEYDDKKEEVSFEDGLIISDTISNQHTKVRYSHHRLKWLDYSKNKYTGDVYIPQNEYLKAYKNRINIDNEVGIAVSFAEYKRKHRALFKNDYYTFYWSWVYLNLNVHDKNSTDIYTFFDTLQMENKLDRVQFANILVSAIQYIPYTLIHSKTCEQLLENGGQNCQSYSCLYHENKYNNDLAHGRPCLPKITFGVQSPVEFLYNFKGDCDTRALLAYTLFTHYGYDAVVLLSKEYGHSVLGLAIPGTGDYVRYKGKKYYFWEMTAKRWEMGQAPPNYNVMGYWHVAAG